GARPWIALPALALFLTVCVLAPEIQGRRAIHNEALAVALAGTPLHRDRAVAAYTELLEARVRRGPPDPDAVAALAALHMTHGHCDRAVAVVLDHGRFAEAERRAIACGLPLLAARAAYEQGAFERAAQAWEAGSARVTEGMEL